MAEPFYAHVKTNPRFERGWNRLQTAVEAFVAVIVVAGLLGLFGTGLLSSTVITSPNGSITVAYERILRRTAQTDVAIRFTQQAGNTLAVDMPSSFVREMDIVSTSPRSAVMHATTNGVAYVFDISNAVHGEITLSMKPKGFGLFDSAFVVGGTELSLRQLVWP